jgi:amino acid adenylation domain-containing protein
VNSAKPFAGNFARRLLETATSFGTEPAVVEGERVTAYEALAGQVLGVAELLQSLNVGPNDRVGLLWSRGSEAAATFFGVLAAGAIATNVNETLRPRQIEHILHHSGAKLLLAEPELLERLPRPVETTASVVPLSELPSATGVDPAARLGSDVAHIVYTSGSTGLPKGVTISHGNLWAGMEAVVQYLGISSRDRIASLLPFSFDYGLNQLLCCTGTGATLVVERSPVAQRIVRTAREQGVTILPAVPPLWLQLLSVDAFCSEPISSLRVMTNTGGRLPREAVLKLQRSQPHASLVLMYGLTEAFRSTYLPPKRVDRKPTSIGQAIPGAEMLVLNEEFAPCKPGEVGELVHRGPTVALGYWNDPEATDRVFRPNPLRAPGAPDSERVVFSGDLVYRDEEGDIFFEGRRDTMIKTLGYRVSPDEVTEVLYASGEVVEAVVAAEEDELRGTRIVAYVVLAENGDLERLKAFCTAELPRYMQPSRFERRSSLSRTSSGKFDPVGTAQGNDDPA